MARINIEDSLYKDGRFTELCIALGSRAMAIGIIVETWTVAQKHWFPNKNGIPKSSWVENKLNSAMIDCGLAVVDGDHIYVKGSEEHFAWMFAAQDRGKKSAEARKKKYGTSQPKRPSDNSRKAFETLSENPEALSPPLTLSLSPSPSLAQSPPPSREKKKEEDSASRNSSPKAPEIPGANLLIAHYCDEWRRAYKAEKSPPISKAIASQFKGLVQDFGVDRAKQLVSGYLQMPDSWYLTKRHDIWTLRQNLNAVSHFIETGKLVSRGEIRDVDSKIGQMNLRKEITEKGV